MRVSHPCCFSLLCLVQVLTAIVSAKPITPHYVDEPALTPAISTTSVLTPASDSDAFLLDAKFDTTSDPLPPNVFSLGFEATGTSEFGDLIRLAGLGHFAESVTLTMTSAALRSDFPESPSAGFTHPVTLTIYAVNHSTNGISPGAVLATLTRNFLIPWRPAPDLSAAPSIYRPWRGADGRAYAATAFNVTFSLEGVAPVLPGEVILAVSFNTHRAGRQPIGRPGPFDFIGVGLSASAPSIGDDVEADAVFWQTNFAPHYTDAGAAGVNIFRRDTQWSHRPALRVNHSAYGVLATLGAQLGRLRAPDPADDERLAGATTLVAWAVDTAMWDGNSRVRPLWGRLVFDAMAEAADELAPLAQREDALAPHARAAINRLLDVAEALVEGAVSDTVIAGGEGYRIAQAQDAFATAIAQEMGEGFSAAIDAFGAAWREADLSSR